MNIAKMKRIFLLSGLMTLLAVIPGLADTSSKLEVIQQDLKNEDWMERLYPLEEADCSRELSRALMRMAESSARVEEACRYRAASNFIMDMWKKRQGFYHGWNRDLLFGLSLDGALFQSEAQRFYGKVAENRTLDSSVREYAGCCSAQVDFSFGRRQEGRSKLEDLLAANPYCDYARTILRNEFPDDYPPLFSFPPADDSSSGIFIR